MSVRKFLASLKTVKTLCNFNKKKCVLEVRNCHYTIKEEFTKGQSHQVGKREEGAAWDFRHKQRVLCERAVGNHL